MTDHFNPNVALTTDNMEAVVPALLNRVGVDQCRSLLAKAIRQRAGERQHAAEVLFATANEIWGEEKPDGG